MTSAVRAEEVARLESLGARVRDEQEKFTVMLDPEGNQFCVCDKGPVLRKKEMS